MDTLVAAAAVLAAVIVVLLVIQRHRAKVRAHVQQLNVKPKRKLVVGTWTREEVSKHKSSDDMWLIIQKQDTKEWRVYDLTDYVDEHPGGLAIMFNAGGDATKGFHGPQHPPTVFELLEEYYIGPLADP